MRAFVFSSRALSISVAAALLSACSSGSSVPIASGNTFLGATGLKHHQTFSYTGKEQTFTVPASVTRLSVIARGGAGTGGFNHGSGHPGFPGRVYAVIRVHPGNKLYVFVAGSGLDGGFNGGGAAGSGNGRGGYDGYGGGASDVRLGGDKLKDRIIVAAGGGTSGNADVYCYCAGGDGGGLNGEPGFGYGTGAYGSGGGGGTQSAGGLGGAGDGGYYGNGQPGGNGALGLGGNGGNGGSCKTSHCVGVYGSGGGGGYYGGGGGGGGGGGEYSASGGGGGGSSYVEPSAITSRMWTGWQGGKADGQIIFSWK